MIGVRTALVLALLLPATVGFVSALAGEPEGRTGQASAQVPGKIPVSVGEKTVQAVLANTDASRVQGLLGWDRITDEEGMLLDFVTTGRYAIHMRGMKFPIDAIWIDDAGIVKLTYEDLQPNTEQIYFSIFPCRYCLEVKAGFCRKFNVKAGQQLRLGAMQ